jgi:GTP cyclohydrolase I
MGFREDWDTNVNIPDLLLHLGEDIDREGLVETPDRVRRAWQELLTGYTLNAEEILSKTFDAEGTGLQLCQGITFNSLCEHHFLGFYGTVTIAYVPNEVVCGLSKLARLVECYGQRLQLQERMTQQIADAIWEHLEPKGVSVMVRARHMCACARGVKQQNMSFVTSAFHGAIDPTVQQLMLQGI